MTMLGKMYYQKETGSFDHVEGKIRTITLDLDLLIQVDKDLSLNTGNTHRVFLKRENDELLEIGYAWESVVKKGANMGQTCLIAKLDDPSFQTPLKFTLFKRGDYAVASFYRPKSKAQGATIGDDEEDFSWLTGSN